MRKHQFLLISQMAHLPIEAGLCPLQIPVAIKLQKPTLAKVGFSKFILKNIKTIPVDRN
jgi:hypothetical protein